jgi:ComF family protein
MPFVTGADHLCGDCLTGHFAFDRARSLFLYQPPITDIILSLKFGGSLTALDSLTALVAASDCGRNFTTPDLILPVPLHPSRLRTRGFNQALLLARACFPRWRQHLDTALLVRSRQTTAQSLLTGKERRTNLRNAFTLTNPSAVAGKRVLLVDDVFTTGSTVNECCKVLRNNGAQRIEVFTLARSLSR